MFICFLRLLCIILGFDLVILLSGKISDVDINGLFKVLSNVNVMVLFGICNLMVLCLGFCNCLGILWVVFNIKVYDSGVLFLICLNVVLFIFV